jgi:hypothetical protein
MLYLWGEQFVECALYESLYHFFKNIVLRFKNTDFNFIKKIKICFFGKLIQVVKNQAQNLAARRIVYLSYKPI